MCRLVVWLLGCAGGSSAQTPPIPAPARPNPAPGLIAVGDLHGDLANATAALRLAGILDADGHWAAGRNTFVQTGDVTDRGPDSKEILDLLRRIGTEAEAAGGRAVLLLGNHEVMNLQGDWRYVSDLDVDHFGGWEARKHAFSPDGEYGKWLATLPVVAIVDDTVFAHGGVHPDWAKGGVDAINAAAHASLWEKGAPIHGTSGPTWYRGLVEQPEETACAELSRSLESLGARRMVVGHTTRRDGHIESRCGGRLAVIDTGISHAYGSHLAAWTSEGWDSAALYPSERRDLPDP